MRWQLPRWANAALIVLVIFVAFGVYLWTRVPATGNISVTWQKSFTGFSVQDQQAIAAKLQNELNNLHNQGLANTRVTIMSAQRQNAWGRLSASVTNPQTGEDIAYENLDFIAHFSANDWSIWTPTSPDFCTQLQQVPDTLFSAGSKQYYCP